MPRWTTILMIIATFAWVLSGCGNQNEFESDEGKINVVSTFYPMYYLAEQIGGEHAHVINLVPTGVEPHDWTPKSQDILNIKKADLFIYNGAGFEGWIDEFLDGIDDEVAFVTVEASQGVELIRAGEELENETEDAIHEEHDHEEHSEDMEEHDHEAEHDHFHEIDPHVWMSPKQMKVLAENVKDGFVEADQANEATYEANYEALVQKLDQLDEQIQQVVNDANRRDFVVSHEAYAYLARDYGLNQIGVMGISPEAEPTAQDIKEVSDFIKEHNVKYILFEELVSPAIAEILVRDLNIESLVFNPLEGLTEEQKEQGNDYISIMEKNLISLEKALQ